MCPRTTNKYYFFHDGPLSQWHPSPFKDDAGFKYSCAEQYMMAQKAIMFDDWDTHKKIMSVNNPLEHKRLGRLVKGFDVTLWNERARDFVLIGSRLKFKIPSLHKFLQDTRPLILVEASPTDRLWGIGLNLDNPKRFNCRNWRGCNWLGEVLMAVRDGWDGTWSDTTHTYKEPPSL